MSQSAKSVVHLFVRWAILIMRLSDQIAYLRIKCKSLLNHPECHQPRLDQLRPAGYRKLRAAQPKRMPALGVQMHLRGNPGVLQSYVVRSILAYMLLDGAPS